MKLEAAFGPVQMTRAPFSWARLLATGHDPVEVESFDVARGLPMDFYRATRRNGPAPCVIMIHGGGWDNRDRSQLPAVNHHLARLGYAVAAVSYRLAPETRLPAIVEDFADACAWVRAVGPRLFKARPCR